MKQNSVRLSEAGYTLVELLVTIVVGAIMVTGVNAIVVSQSFLGERSRDLVLANTFAEGKFEELRSIGYLGLTNGTTNITTQLPSELKTPRSGELVITSQTSAIKRVVVTISYNEQGVSRTYSYTTLIGELGVGQY